MFDARNKTDLIIEVWEKLDCESVGESEIIAIEQAILERFGKAAVDSPMIIARLLADEGAELRHSEIMQLYLERRSDLPYEAAFRNILGTLNFREVLASVRNLENLRRKYLVEGDQEGLRLIHQKAQEGRKKALATARKKNSPAADRRMNAEIAEWLTLWMHSPEMFETWVKLRKASVGFQEQFGNLNTK